MRIIHIAPSFETSTIHGNGIYEVLINLCSQQIELGHFSKILSIGSFSPNNIVEYITIKLFKKQMDKYTPDIVVFHSLYKWQYIIFAEYLIKLGIPYCIQLHGGASKNNHQKGYIKKVIANFLLFNRFISKAHRLIYLNIDEYENSVFNNIQTNYSIIPNGVNIPDMYNKNENSDINILFLGRIDYNHKGLDFLIGALKLINDQNKKLTQKIKVNIVGNGYDLNRLKQDIEPLNKFVYYLGAKFGDDKIEQYKNADIYILTSRYEGMPMSILEALSYGCPCIITPETNMSDIIINKSAGWITSTNSEIIARDIEEAISDFSLNREKYIRNARKSVNDYSWEKIAALSIEEYL